MNDMTNATGARCARPRTAAGAAGAAAAAGLVIGALTLAGQALPRFLLDHGIDDAVTGAIAGFIAQHLGNSGAAWSLWAFLAGALLPVRRWLAALAGLLVLLGATLGYYSATTVFLHDDVSNGVTSSLVWGAVSLVAGPLFGAAGALWLRGPARLRPWAPALIGGLFLAEGLYYALVLRYQGDAIASALTGLVLVCLLERSGEGRRAALVRLLPATLVMSLALAGAVGVTVLGFS